MTENDRPPLIEADDSFWRRARDLRIGDVTAQWGRVSHVEQQGSSWFGSGSMLSRHLDELVEVIPPRKAWEVTLRTEDEDVAKAWEDHGSRLFGSFVNVGSVREVEVDG